MRNYYIITFHIPGAKSRLDAFNRKIRTYGTWAKLTDNTYIIITNQSAEQVRNFLMSDAKTNDLCFVGTLIGQMAWNLPEEVAIWIRNNIR